MFNHVISDLFICAGLGFFMFLFRYSRNLVCLQVHIQSDSVKGVVHAIHGNMMLSDCQPTRVKRMMLRRPRMDISFNLVIQETIYVL